MKPETSKKRLHSALKGHSIIQGRKRTKHELESGQPAIITEVEASHSSKHSFQSQSRNKPKDFNQPPILGDSHDLLSRSLNDSSDEKRILINNLEPSSLNSSMFLSLFS